MKRINKDLSIYVGVLVLFGASLFFFLEKLPRLISHAVYYCQSGIVSLLTPIPPLVLLTPVLLLAGFFSFSMIKMIAMMVQAKKVKQMLDENIHHDRSIEKLLKTLNLSGKTFVVKSNKPFAFCLGIFSPKIYLSSSLLAMVSIEELEVVLRHERYHLNKRDTLTMAVASFCKSFLPFLPILSDMINNYRVDRELQADREAIKYSGKAHLASVLKKLLRAPSPSYAFAPAIVEHDTLAPRIAAITDKHTTGFRRFKGMNILITTLAIFLISFVTLGPVHAMHIHSTDTHVIMLHAAEDACLDWGNTLNVHP